MTNTSVEHEIARIAALVEAQRRAHLAEGPVSAEARIDRLNRVIGLLVDHQQDIVEAVQADFGTRSHDFSRVTEVLSPLMALKHARAHVAEWMKSQPRASPRGVAWIEYQPLGVVGVIAPWNFPVNLAFLPLAGILAAGNRAIIKPSEFTPHTSALIERMVASAFDATELAVVTGGAQTGEAFSRQRFDHILFTGATSIGRHVMRAASENLVPVTLELGGKSPAIVSVSDDFEASVKKIVTGKLHNAGQICLSPDYVFVPEGQVEAFVEIAQRTVAAHFPTLRDNADYTSIINERHRQRLANLVEDARRRGSQVIELNPAEENFTATGKLVPALVIDPADDAAIMQDEIFGPLLPVKPYKKIEDVVAFINARPRPLGLYYFGADAAEERFVLERTLSGGVTLGDVIRHVGVEDLPFGGVGPSGMGCYHGCDGFETFSHARAIYRVPAQDVDLLRPPYVDQLRQMVASLITR
jgi:coniferyl-aldehyde dehydrogenase